MTGALEFSTASPGVVFVQKPTQSTLHTAWLTLSLGLLATFCPCVVYGQNRQRLRHLKDRGVPLPGGGDRVNQDCRAHCCMLPCFYWVFEVCGDGDKIHVDDLPLTQHLDGRSL